MAASLRARLRSPSPTANIYNFKVILIFAENHCSEPDYHQTLGSSPQLLGENLLVSHLLKTS